MAVKLRLQRFGSKRRPYYRVVAADSNSPRDGRFIEIIGTYNPIKYVKDGQLVEVDIKIDSEKALKWLRDGAKPTDTVKNLLSGEGILKTFHEETKKPKSAKPNRKSQSKKADKKTETKEA